MAQNLAQNFIHLRGLTLAPQTFTELGFNHRERRFNIAALVIVHHKASYKLGIGSGFWRGMALWSESSFDYKGLTIERF